MRGCHVWIFINSINSTIFRKIEQDNCFIIQHIDNKGQILCSRKAGGDLYLLKKKLVTFDRARGRALLKVASSVPKFDKFE